MTPEQEALLQKARDSAQAAQMLLDEGYCDFAVSRAYYAMFYVAQALLLDMELSFSKHSGVIAAFGQHFAKTDRVPREFHRYLIEAQESRQTGDYDTGPGLSPEETKCQIDRAGEFISLGERMLTSSN